MFEGNKYLTYEEGYKTSPTGTIRYYMDNTGIYQVMGDNRTLIHDFYLGIDTQYMDLAHVFDIMNANQIVFTQAAVRDVEEALG